jgi:hypothetical protein
VRTSPASWNWMLIGSQPGPPDNRESQSCVRSFRKLSQAVARSGWGGDWGEAKGTGKDT